MSAWLQVVSAAAVVVLHRELDRGDAAEVLGVERGVRPGTIVASRPDAVGDRVQRRAEHVVHDQAAAWRARPSPRAGRRRRACRTPPPAGRWPTRAPAPAARGCARGRGGSSRSRCPRTGSARPAPTRAAVSPVESDTMWISSRSDTSADPIPEPPAGSPAVGWDTAAMEPDRVTLVRSHELTDAAPYAYAATAAGRSAPDLHRGRLPTGRDGRNGRPGRRRRPG